MRRLGVLLAFAALACAGSKGPTESAPPDSEGVVEDSPSPETGDDSASPEDIDGDGFSVDEDCDDSDASVNPGAEEDCANGRDDDCDKRLDCEDSECTEACSEDCDSPGDEDGNGYADCLDEACWGQGECEAPRIRVNGGHVDAWRFDYAYEGGWSGVYLRFYPTGTVELGSGTTCTWSLDSNGRGLGFFFVSDLKTSMVSGSVGTTARGPVRVDSQCPIGASSLVPPGSQMLWAGSGAVLSAGTLWYDVGPRQSSTSNRWTWTSPYGNRYSSTTWQWRRSLGSGSWFTP